MNRVKILAIAPYEGLRDLIMDEASTRQDVEVHCYVADMSDGAKYAKSIQHGGYSMIISRAGTAELIERACNLPVIDIKISVYDMLRAIRLAQNYSGRFAIVGFPMITDCANIICELLQYHIDIFTINEASEISGCLKHLKSQGYSLIVGDVITLKEAKRQYFNEILVTSGRESVKSALDEAVKLHKSFSKTQNLNFLYKDILDCSNPTIIAYEDYGDVLYSNIYSDKNETALITNELVKYIETLKTQTNINLLKKFANNLWNVSGKRILSNDRSISVFHLTTHMDCSKIEDNAITFKNIDDAPLVSFETFYDSSENMRKLIDCTKKYSSTNLPVMIYGQQGTGKDTVAYAVYHYSNFKNNPFIIIDCRLISEKRLDSILKNSDSPFNNTEYTIYIKNLHCLSEYSQKNLEFYMSNTLIHKRNRIIFSCIIGYSQQFDDSSLLDYIRNKLCALELTLPSLNERQDDIPSLASLYISEVNLKVGKQVIGLEADALALLQQFKWDNNIDQFKRIINELVAITDTAYINSENVRQVLKNDQLSCAIADGTNLNLSGTLDDITSDIIKFVLEQENMNQTKAAKRLGISRSTMWRKLK